MSIKLVKGGDVFKKLDKKLKDNKYKLEVGFFEGQQRKSGNKSIPQAQIAYWNEYGTDDGNIPPRPFMRKAVDTKSKKWLEFLKKELVLNKLDIKPAINKLGIIMEGDIVQEITDLQTPPNAESTIKAKGSSKPLVDTGIMRQSVKHKVKG